MIDADSTDFVGHERPKNVEKDACVTESISPKILYKPGKTISIQGYKPTQKRFGRTAHKCRLRLKILNYVKVGFERCSQLVEVSFVGNCATCRGSFPKAPRGEPLIAKIFDPAYVPDECLDGFHVDNDEPYKCAFGRFSQEFAVYQRLHDRGLKDIAPECYGAYTLVHSEFRAPEDQLVHLVVMKNIRGYRLDTLLSHYGKPGSEELPYIGNVLAGQILQRLHAAGISHQDGYGYNYRVEWDPHKVYILDFEGSVFKEDCDETASGDWEICVEMDEDDLLCSLKQADVFRNDICPIRGSVL
jgi:serine/threonine protein kinase